MVDVGAAAITAFVIFVVISVVVVAVAISVVVATAAAASALLVIHFCGCWTRSQLACRLLAQKAV